MTNAAPVPPERPAWALPMVGAFGCLLVLLIAAVGGGVWYWRSRQATPAPQPTPTTDIAPSVSPLEAPPSAELPAPGQPASRASVAASGQPAPPAPLAPQLAAAAPFPAEILRTGGSVREPRRRKYVAPAYPDSARQAHLQGLVKLEAWLDAEGRVVDVRIVRSVPAFDQAAADAVRQWLYEPTLVNGQAVPVIHSIEIVFKIEDEEEDDDDE